MKHIIYILSTTLFLNLFSGCGGGSTPPNDSIDNAPVMKLTSKVGVDEILLQWTKVEGVSAYLLEWSQNSDALENSIDLDSTQTEYLHQDLEPEMTYYYRMTATFEDSQNDEVSETVAVKTGSVVQIIQSDVAY